MEAALAVLLQEGEEVRTADALDATGHHGFRSDFVWSSGDDGTEAQDVARHCHFEDKGLAFARRAGEFDLTGAEDQDGVGAVLFTEERGSTLERGLDSYCGIVGKCGAAEVAECSEPPHLAGGTAMRNKWVGGHGRGFSR